MSHRRPTGGNTTITNLIFRNHRFALFLNFCIWNKDPHYDGMGVYCWPPLHRPGVTIHWFDPHYDLYHLSTVTRLQPSSPALSINASSPSTCPRHQHVFTISTPTHFLLSVDNPHLTTSRQLLPPLVASKDKHSHKWRLLWIARVTQIDHQAIIH